MDPQATWTELLEAREHGAWDRAEELANPLLDWMDRKGFPPPRLWEANRLERAGIGRLLTSSAF